MKFAYVNRSGWAIKQKKETDKLFRADSRFAPSQWETFQSNPVSHYLGPNLESALLLMVDLSTQWKEIA